MSMMSMNPAHHGIHGTHAWHTRMAHTHGPNSWHTRMAHTHGPNSWHTLMAYMYGWQTLPFGDSAHLHFLCLAVNGRMELATMALVVSSPSKTFFESPRSSAINARLTPLACTGVVAWGPGADRKVPNTIASLSHAPCVAAASLEDLGRRKMLSIFL